MMRGIYRHVICSKKLFLLTASACVIINCWIYSHDKLLKTIPDFNLMHETDWLSRLSTTTANSSYINSTIIRDKCTSKNRTEYINRLFSSRPELHEGRQYRGPTLLDRVPLLQSPPPCEPGTNIVIFIHSATKNAQRRHFIRNSWARESKLSKAGGERHVQARVVFILGEGQPRCKFNDVTDESERHNDIVQYDFVDSYKNISFKHLLGIRWVKEHCPDTQYTMKSDDDVLIDIIKVIEHIFYTPQIACGFHCNVLEKWTPVRETRSQYYISRKQYPQSWFPNFCQGLVYIIDTGSLMDVYLASDVHYFVWLDDVFVTGILANVARVHRTQWPDKEKIKLYDKYGKSKKTLRTNTYVVMQQVDDLQTWRYVWEGKGGGWLSWFGY